MRPKTHILVVLGRALNKNIEPCQNFINKNFCNNFFIAACPPHVDSDIQMAAAPLFQTFYKKYSLRINITVD
jgi:hypothetical protein